MQNPKLERLAESTSALVLPETPAALPSDKPCRVIFRHGTYFVLAPFRWNLKPIFAHCKHLSTAARLADVLSHHFSERPQYNFSPEQVALDIRHPAVADWFNALVVLLTQMYGSFDRIPITKRTPHQ